MGALLSCALSWSQAGASFLAPDRVQARLSLGHDSNLLDISDLERESFETGDEHAFFVVDRMADQFGEAEVGAEWKTPRLLGGRHSLHLGWERRQYLHDPIKSADRLTFGLRVRPGDQTRLDLEVVSRPLNYVRHRFDRNALPGEPQFRPEAYRRWDFDLETHQGLGSKSTMEVLIEGSTRNYRAPFDERDRVSFGGGGGLAHSFGRGLEVHAGVRYRATWTENEAWDPDDRSHREWRASSGIELGRIPLLKAVKLDLELEWRRFTSEDPDDQDHFGRHDRGGEAELEIVRGLGRSLAWISRATHRWRSSDFPVAAFDEEGIFEEDVFRTEVMWEWEAP